MPAPLKFAFLVALAAMAAPTLAADPVADNTPPAPTASTTNATGSETAAAASPNKLICRKQEQLGSRLRSNKVCMTQSEWAEQRRQDRMNVDRSQRNRWTQGN
ncbi:hypothetical protein ASE00_11270 [Sphingomonas sp. Root710]|uniref:hypothetical protein n=1 Tax=Sphingomonas sp. Root710 TaxID=1736594 RepID=UPI0006FB0146|nr:hypothetical protein [Sphingomonas sp. Root710]KRB82613.1 hypothetical protein ASE00_11270 [Sphingomonas sp. Root710]